MVYDYELYLKELVKLTENRYIEYTKMLEDNYKDKINFPPKDELSIWYKELLKEEKKQSEINLKSLREELTYYRQGLNPPYCYPEYWRLKEKKEREQNGIKTHLN